MLNTTVSVNKGTRVSLHQTQILRTLMYYHLFKYPLTKEEMGFGDEVNVELQDLVDREMIFKNGEFYSMSSDLELMVRRLHGNKKAHDSMPKAIRRARLIFGFPFVRGVYISGSLSKGFLSEEGDVDFFIITKPEMLWFTRSLLILFKKIFLLNNREFFCLNYFIDSEHLQIEEKNIFTATELKTLIPMCEDGVHDRFSEANRWIKKYYPNAEFKSPMLTLKGKSVFKSFLEFLFNNRLGNLLDQFFMRLTMNVWKKKFTGFEPHDFKLAMKSRSYVSKHHPQNFQRKVLDGFSNELESFRLKHNVDLNLK